MQRQIKYHLKALDFTVMRTIIIQYDWSQYEEKEMQLKNAEDEPFTQGKGADS